jgi:hypothetical protein
VTPVVQAVYSWLLERASEPPHAAHAGGLRAAFAQRCGETPGDDPRAEARQGAGWEDALIEGGLAKKLAAGLTDPAECEVARLIAGAQRGVYVFEADRRSLRAVDLWSRAVFVMAERDHVCRELDRRALSHDSPICQGHILASNEGCLLLPGTIFHPIDARAPIVGTLERARERRLPRRAVLDALLSMEHAFRTLSRVKVAFAYRPEALPRGAAPLKTGS